MIIKKYVGKTEEEATEQAQKELGSNVVVLNVRSTKAKGFLSFLKPQLKEVTVALEEESEKTVAAKAEDQRIRAAVSAVNQVVGDSDKREQPKPEEAAQPKSGSNAIEKKLDSLQSLIEQQIMQTEPEIVKDKQEEASKEDSAKDQEIIKFMRLLYNTMIDNEVNEKYANQIIDEMEKMNKPGMPFDYALANVYQKMILKFGKPSEITPAQKGPKILFFVGPTGVGKTTTIAKIASKFSVDEGKKVALLTADTYRIAAAEQLRTYANILEVPFRVIYTTEEVGQALVDFKDYDYVLVDTAGHSHHNEAQKETMKDFVHSADGLAEKEVFLVLSATTKYSDLISIVDAYSAMTDYKLIFTKLDETDTLGNLLNIKLYTGADLSYVTCGQNVPDDIENFNPQKTVKQLLGGRKN